MLLYVNVYSEHIFFRLGIKSNGFECNLVQAENMNLISYSSEVSSFLVIFHFSVRHVRFYQK